MGSNRRKIKTAVAVLLTLVLFFGCTNGVFVRNDEQQVSDGIAARTDAIEPSAHADTSATPSVPLTSEPISAPTPDPLIGSWSAEAFPFVLTIGSNGTYAASSGGRAVSGAYTASDTEIELLTGGQHTVRFRYEPEADVLISDTGVLTRSGEEAPNPDGVAPVTFRSENDFISVSVRGAVADVVVKDGRTASEYCFTCRGIQPPKQSRDWFSADESGEPCDHFRVFKYDGSYTLWIRDADGAMLDPLDIDVVSGYLYPIRSEGLQPVQTSLSQLLSEHGTDTEELDRRIGADIAAAGLYTREGVVTAGVSLISHVAQYGCSVIYQGRGSYQGETDWGVNPEWGSKLKKPTSDGNGTYYYTGMQCVASIVWAYKQAGMNLVSNLGSKIGDLGERERSHDNRIAYDSARSGDIVQTGGHYLMIVDRLDRDCDGVSDAYLTYEMCAPHLTMLILTFRQVRGRTFYSMRSFFDGTGRNAKHMKYWDNTFRIPEDALPDFIKDAVTGEDAYRQTCSFLKQFGL